MGRQVPPSAAKGRTEPPGGARSRQGPPEAAARAARLREPGPENTQIVLQQPF